MADAAVKEKPAAETELTDGFNLIIDALKLNGLNTIYGVPGIPITDFGRMAQAAGIRVLSFRHEQNAGYAASIAGFLTKKPGVCLTVSAPGFLNGLTALAHATTNCFPMILISGSSEREIVDLQQGDYEEMDQLAIAKPLCKAAYRVLHAQDIGIALARAIRAAVSGRPGGVYLDLPAKLFGQVMDAEAGKKSLVKVIDAAPAHCGCVSGNRPFAMLIGRNGAPLFSTKLRIASSAWASAAPLPRMISGRLAPFSTSSARLTASGAGIWAGAASITFTSDFFPASASITWPNSLAGRSR